VNKYWTTDRYKRYNARHAKRSLQRRLSFKEYKRQKNTSEQGLSKEKKKHKHEFEDKLIGYKKVKAPEDFSFKGNPERVIEFLNKVKECFDKRQKIFVVLEAVKKIDFDAIVVLFSIMIRFKSQNIQFNGDFPKEKTAKTILTQSGFFKNLFKHFRDEERYTVKTENDHSIHTHAFKNVDSELGAKIIQQASKTIWGEERRCQGAQRTLLELMQNTNNHASFEKEGDKHWWLSVNHDKKNKKVSFSFVDYGVGVFKSLTHKPEGSKFFNVLDKMVEKFKYGNNAELIKLVLNGELHKTVTGEHYRGKGLPGIREAMRRNQISNLVVVTNNVYANVANDEFKLLNSNFTGTFLNWELNINNISCNGKD
jgi:hypothetical protein